MEKEERNKIEREVFNSKIRKVWDKEKEEWFFSVVDVVGVLSESIRPRKYWVDLKVKLNEEGFQLSDFIGQLKMPSNDGKSYMTDCADMKGIFRIIQSIPSKKAEPFKLWLAKVGSERLDEQVNPELAIDRAMKNYLDLGYNEKWINQRLKSIEVRKELTDEWKRSGVDEGDEFSILTNDLTKAWSGKTIREYKELKGLTKEGLRDNMTNLELVLNMLAEAATAEISKKESPEGFGESQNIVTRGGEVAGSARENIEEQIGESVISSKNMRDIIVKDDNKKMLESDE